MPVRPSTFRPPHSETRVQQAKRHDEHRGSARARGYTGAWDKARAGYLRSHPLCAYCALDGVVTPATLVDHLYPHRTYEAAHEGLFWAKEWWVASCVSCHSGPKQAAERAGRAALDALARRLGRPLLTWPSVARAQHHPLQEGGVSNVEAPHTPDRWGNAACGAAKLVKTFFPARV